MQVLSEFGGVGGLGTIWFLLMSKPNLCSWNLPHLWLPLVPPSRWGGEEPPEGHPHRHRVLPPHLLCGLLRRVRCPYCDDAVLYAGQKQPTACGFQVRGLGGGHLRSGGGFPLCPVHQVGPAPQDWCRAHFAMTACTLGHVHVCAWIPLHVPCVLFTMDHLSPLAKNNSRKLAGCSEPLIEVWPNVTFTSMVARGRGTK